MRSRFVLISSLAVLVIAVVQFVPSTKAQQDAPNRRGEWEYKVVGVSIVFNEETREQNLNKLGQERWELSQSVQGILIFKRPRSQ